MTKRSAMTMAAGLAMALLVGVVAVSMMLGSASVATASREHKSKPIMKRHVQTVTVHRTAPATNAPTVRVVHLSPTSGYAPASTTSMSSGYADDGGFESDGGSDDGGSTLTGGGSQGNYGDD
jgi:uncharacterized membrane protein YgcG